MKYASSFFNALALASVILASGCAATAANTKPEAAPEPAQARVETVGQMLAVVDDDMASVYYAGVRDAMALSMAASAEAQSELDLAQCFYSLDSKAVSTSARMLSADEATTSQHPVLWFVELATIVCGDEKT